MKIKTTATITSRGQITVPAYVRKRVELKRGDNLAITVVDDDELRATLLKPRKGARRL